METLSFQRGYSPKRYSHGTQGQAPPETPTPDYCNQELVYENYHRRGGSPGHRDFSAVYHGSASELGVSGPRDAVYRTASSEIGINPRYADRKLSYRGNGSDFREHVQEYAEFSAPAERRVRSSRRDMGVRIPVYRSLDDDRARAEHGWYSPDRRHRDHRGSVPELGVAAHLRKSSHDFRESLPDIQYHRQAQSEIGIPDASQGIYQNTENLVYDYARPARSELGVYEPRVKFQENVYSWRDKVITVEQYSALSDCYRQRWAKGHRMYQIEPGSRGRPWVRGGYLQEPLVRVTPDTCYGIVEDFEWDEVGLEPPRRRQEARAISLERVTTPRRRRNDHLTPPRRYRSPLRSPVLGINPDFISPGVGSRVGDVSSPNVGAGSAGAQVTAPPLKQLRSYSVDNGCHQVPGSAPAFGRNRQRSASGHLQTGHHKKSSRRLDEEALKRSRLHTNQYELSQDLLDKQVEMLERKYGGVRARHAALTIQRAFRKYCMVKRFQDIANASKGEKRLSRRMYTLDLDNKEWVLYNNNANNHLKSRSSRAIYETAAEDESQSMHLEAMLQQANYASLHYEETGSRPTRSMSLRQASRTRDQAVMANGTPNHYQSNNATCRCGTATDSSSASDYDGLNSNGSVYYSAPPQRLAQNSVSWSGSKGTNYKATYLPPSQSPECVETEQHRYHAARESLSSEDSAIGSSGLGELELDRPVVAPASRTEGLQRNLVRTSDSALLRKVLPVPSDAKKMPPSVPRRTSSIGSGKQLPQQQGNVESQFVVRSGSTSSSAGSESLKGTDSSYDAVSVSSSGSSGTGVVVVTPASTTTTATTPGTVPPTDGHRHKQFPVEASPVWKRKSLVLAEQTSTGSLAEDKRLSNISENSEDSLDGGGGGGYCTSPPSADMILMGSAGHGYGLVQTAHDGSVLGHKLSEVQRKRQYRVGLNLFNKKPEKGIPYLIQRGFLEATPQAVARFLISRKGLSKQMIGEYLGNLQSQFNMAVLEYFVQELDLAGMQVDVALRKFQTYFRLPGEAQKIERLMEVFSHRFVECNRDIVSKFNNPDTVFVLAFAIIMLNTDLHTPNMKAEKRMKTEDFIKNLRGVDDGQDLDKDMLTGIYERIKANEFKPGSDHVTQVLKVHQTIVGKKPNLALPHRRLVCYCRLYEVFDVSKKERPGVHQREVFLFNDMLMVTKIFSKKKNSVTYTFRQSFPLSGMTVTLFEAPHYQHGIHLSQRVDDKVLMTFNARNEHDRSKFVEDLKESILEMDEMENLRIESELEKQKLVRPRGAENRDSGVADMEILPGTTNGGPSCSGMAGPCSKEGNSKGLLTTEGGGLLHHASSASLKRSALSNSLLDLHEQQLSKPVRRGSAGSLDSGMSISFQSSAASTVSRDSSPQTLPASKVTATSPANLSVASEDGATTSSASLAGPSAAKSPASGGQQSFLGGLFGKKQRNPSKPSL